MIELILGIVALIAALGLAFFVVAAGAMSDTSSAAANAIIVPYLWTIFGGWAVAESVLFFIWYAKHRGWS